MLPFIFTRYYEPEMGDSLWRKFIIFQKPIKKKDLVCIKMVTIDLEQLFATSKGGLHCRRINLDPGYMTLGQLVLTTTKDRAHRIYLGDGIFADLHLLYQGGCFRPLQWTYPDYRSPVALTFFSQARAKFHFQLKTGSHSSEQ